jgi:hypothetical protein
MKHTSLLYLLIFFLFTACQREEESQPSGTGYLSLSSLEVSNVDVVPVKTRAVNAELAIEIEKADGTPVVSYEAGAPETSAKIELEAGEYMLKAYTSNYGQVWDDSAQGEPVFYKEQRFTIAAEKVNYLTVICPMVNIGVRLVLPEGFSEWFNDYSFSARIGERNVNLRNGETAYYALPDEGQEAVELSYSLSATNADNESLNKEGSYTGITAGVVYEITYSFASQSFVLR